MPVCSKIRKKKRQICIGDMRDRVILEDRDLTAPFVGVDASEVFSNASSIWAMIETVDGVEFFNSVNQAVDVTHFVYVNFDSSITVEKWLRLENGQRLDILKVDNLDERNSVLKLQCTNRGQDTKEAASA